MEQVRNASLLEERLDSVRRLCTDGEPLEDLFLFEADFRLLEVRVEETDLCDEAIVAGPAVVDVDDALDRVVTLAEAGETDNSCHFIPLYGVFPEISGF